MQMRFDRTKGMKARYMVNVYGQRVEDHYYYHYFKEADKFFNELLRIPQEQGTILSIWDLQKDVRKGFQRF